MLNSSNLLPATWPYSKVGLFVPSDVNLAGSKDLNNPTFIQVDNSVTESVNIVLVSQDRMMAGRENATVQNSSVSYFTISGNKDADPTASQCDRRSLTLNSISDIDAYAVPPKVPAASAANLKHVGVQVDTSVAPTAAVNVHHVVVGHTNIGIQYGWNTPFVKENASCQSKSCFTFAYQDTNADGSCPGPAPDWYPMNLKLPRKSCLPQNTCVHVVPVIEVPACVPKFCPSMPYEYQGPASARAKVHNNSVCNNNGAINIAGGNVDVFRNFTIRNTIGNEFANALNPDGHVSSGVSFYENYIHGYDKGSVVDGSQYVVVSAGDYLNITGYANDACPNSWDDTFLYLQQIIFDHAQKSFITTAPFLGMINNLSYTNNRFINTTEIGISLYRVNWASVGNNIFESSSPNSTAILLDNGLNSWIYGNSITAKSAATSSKGIKIAGSPGMQSKWGSCYNGIGSKYDFTSREITLIANAYSGLSCNVNYTKNYCRTDNGTVLGTTEQCKTE